MAYFDRKTLEAAAYGPIRVSLDAAALTDEERVMTILAGELPEDLAERLARVEQRRFYRDDDGEWYLAPIDDDELD